MIDGQAQEQRDAAAEREQLLARIARLEARMDAAEGRSEGRPAGSTAADAAPAQRSSRRGLIGAAGAAVTGAAAGSLAQAQPAAAANGGSLVLGQVNDATNKTLLKYDAASPEFPDEDFHLLVSAFNAPASRAGLVSEGSGDGVIGFAGDGGWGVYGAPSNAVGVGGFPTPASTSTRRVPSTPKRCVQS